VPMPQMFPASDLVLGVGLLLTVYAMVLGLFGLDPIDREVGVALWARLRRRQIDA